jgi:hypothetical protein
MPLQFLTQRKDHLFPYKGKSGCQSDSRSRPSVIAFVHIASPPTAAMSAGDFTNTAVIIYDLATFNPASGQLSPSTVNKIPDTYLSEQFALL